LAAGRKKRWKGRGEEKGGGLAEGETLFGAWVAATIAADAVGGEAAAEVIGSP